MPTIDAFLEALTLEPVGEDRYRATNLPSAHGVVFGGQLLAQSIMAGLAGQEGKAVKTLHTVFARGASHEAPLEIAVERMHAGRSVASSTVTISQGDQICTRSLVLLSALEDDVIRHADARRSTSSPDDVAGHVRGEGAWELGIVGNVDISDPEPSGRPSSTSGSASPALPTTPRPTRRSSPIRPTASSSARHAPARGRRPGPGARHAVDRRAQPHAHVPRACPAAEWHLLEQPPPTPARPQLRPRRDLPLRRAAGRVVRAGRHDPRPLGSAGKL